MNRSEKAQVIENLSQRVGEAKCLYLTDFTGLDVASMTELRARLSGAEVEYVVVKNTLARRALEDGPYAELSEHLEGPNAFAMSTADVVNAAKILTEFAEEREKPSIKAGAIEGRVVSIDEIRRLAALPPREELLAQMVGYAKAPVQGLVFTLNGLLAKFVRTLDAVRAQKEEEGEAAPASEEPAAEAGEAPAEEPEAVEPAEEAEAAASEEEPAAVEVEEEDDAAGAEEVDDVKVEEDTTEVAETEEAELEEAPPATEVEESAEQEAEEQEAEEQEAPEDEAPEDEVVEEQADEEEEDEEDDEEEDEEDDEEEEDEEEDEEEEDEEEES